MDNYSFRHLDTSVRDTYRGTVLFGLELPDVCLLVRVKNDYVVDTPTIQEYKWIRGQSLNTLQPFFNMMKPLRIIVDAY